MNQKQTLEQLLTAQYGKDRPFLLTLYKNGTPQGYAHFATHHLAYASGQNWCCLNSAHTYKVEEEIKTFGFRVEYGGDPSVGMMPQTWAISGEFTFSSREDFEAFKQAIAGAFEYCSDTPIVCVSVEEWADQVNENLAGTGGRFHL